MSSLHIWAEWSGLFRDPAIRLEIPWAQLEISEDAPFLDVGAGTGRETIQIADELPSHKVVALEPDSSMRIALMARLSDRSDLHARVTVLPVRLEDVPTSYKFSGALLQGVAASLSDMFAAWQAQATVLLPGAPVLVNHLHTGSTKNPVERRLISSAELGKLS